MICWSAAASGLQHAAVLARRVRQHAALADRERERLLTVHVLARHHRGLRDCGMPVIGRANEDDVDVVARNQFFMITVDLDSAGGAGLVLAISSLEPVTHLLGLAPHQIARGDYPAIVSPRHRRGVTAANQSVADEADGKLIARGSLAEQSRWKKVRRQSVREYAGETVFQDRATGERPRRRRQWTGNMRGSHGDGLIRIPNGSFSQINYHRSTRGVETVIINSEARKPGVARCLS
jgi:hypothetical protein